MEQQDYLIAGHRVRVEGPLLPAKFKEIRGFGPFEAADGGEPLCRFALQAVDEAMPGMAERWYHSEANGTVSNFGPAEGGGYAFDMTPSDGSGTLRLWSSPDGAQARFGGNLGTELLRFAAWIAYGVATVPLQTVAIHASTICCHGKAVLFLGESGTGKSTHTRLWRENIVGATLLNDDSPIVRIIDGEPWACGSPWSGKTPCYKDERYPLAACVRLSQAPCNRIERLSILKAFAALHPSCPPAFAYDERLYDALSDTLSHLLSAVPVFHLDCLPDADAARLSYRTIFNNA